MTHQHTQLFIMTHQHTQLFIMTHQHTQLQNIKSSLSYTKVKKRQCCETVTLFNVQNHIMQKRT
jgi:hypothetical protein